MMAAEVWMFHNPGPQISLSLVLPRYPLFNVYDISYGRVNLVRNAPYPYTAARSIGAK